MSMKDVKQETSSEEKEMTMNIEEMRGVETGIMRGFLLLLNDSSLPVFTEVHTVLEKKRNKQYL